MKILITGGCGFIGRNSAEKMLRLGHKVTVLDNLSRPGSETNLTALRSLPAFDFEHADVRDKERFGQIVMRGGFDVILHLAAQVAVTTSISDPRADYDINALGTFNVLEAVRLHSPETVVLNASTNKVYGDLHEIGYSEEPTRYRLSGLPNGVSEAQPLSFHSPYGCSKGAADQYVMDYARSFGLRTVTLRQSCIYGYWQFGIEDQGWVAWFIIAHLMKRPITVFGSGKQVRDVLFVEDLVDCYLCAIEKIDHLAGMAFNIGGGPENTMSLLEFLSELSELSGTPVDYRMGPPRPGDQPVFISNIEKARALLGWTPQVSRDAGIRKLFAWVNENRRLFEKAAAS